MCGMPDESEEEDVRLMPHVRGTPHASDKDDGRGTPHTSKEDNVRGTPSSLEDVRGTLHSSEEEEEGRRRTGAARCTRPTSCSSGEEDGRGTPHASDEDDVRGTLCA